MSGQKTDKTIFRYLLGQLPEEEQVRVEQEYFGNTEMFERFLAVEDQLIDDYLRGQLPNRDLRLFESHFLSSPRRAERVESARQLIKAVSKPAVEGAASVVATSPSQILRGPYIPVILRLLSPAARLSLAAITALVVIGGALLINENARLRNRIEQLQAEQEIQARREEDLQKQLAEKVATGNDPAGQEQPRQTEPEPQSPKPANQDALPAVLSFSLKPGMKRGSGGGNRLEIPQGIHPLQIQVSFMTDDDYQSYRVEVRTAEGNRVWARSNLRAKSHESSRTLMLKLSSSVLPKGPYVLTLSGVTASGELQALEDYSFTVIRR